MKSLAWLGRLSAVELYDFWSRVKTRSTTRPCWEWTGAKGPTGYGIHRIRSRNIAAHRLAFYIAHAFDPGDMLVLHCCDNPRCVNGRHLRLGTAAENARDREATKNMLRGRGIARSGVPDERAIEHDNWCNYERRSTVRRHPAGNSGDVNPNALLKNDQAIALRADFWAGMTVSEVAAKYGVSRGVADNVIARHAYVNLPLAAGEPAKQGPHERARAQRRIDDARRGHSDNIATGGASVHASPRADLTHADARSAS